MELNVNPKGPRFLVNGNTGSVEIHFMDDETFEGLVIGSESGFKAHIVPGPVACMPGRIDLEFNGILSSLQLPPEISGAYTKMCEYFTDGKNSAREAVDTLIAWVNSELGRFPYV